MKLGSLRALSICGAMLALVIAPAGSAGAGSATGRHCAYRLVPESHPRPHVVSARLEKVGCFSTFVDAVAAGSGGSIRLPLSTSPPQLTDGLIARSTRTLAGDDTLIGTEWFSTNYGGASRNYWAPNACAGTTYEVQYVHDAQNDAFESGKGFGGCDNNKKFADSGFGGAVLTCTPNCSDYGPLRNEVSSLRWKP